MRISVLFLLLSGIEAIPARKEITGNDTESDTRRKREVALTATVHQTKEATDIVKLAKGNRRSRPKKTGRKKKDRGKTSRKDRKQAREKKRRERKERKSRKKSKRGKKERRKNRPKLRKPTGYDRRHHRDTKTEQTPDKLLHPAFAETLNMKTSGFENVDIKVF